MLLPPKPSIRVNILLLAVPFTYWASSIDSLLGGLTQHLGQHLSAFNKRDPLMIQSLIKYSVMELRRVLKKDVMEVTLQGL